MSIVASSHAHVNGHHDHPLLLPIPHNHHYNSFSQPLSNAPPPTLPSSSFSNQQHNNHKVFPNSLLAFNFFFFFQFLCFYYQFGHFDSGKVGGSKATMRSATISANSSLLLAFPTTTFPPQRNFCTSEGNPFIHPSFFTSMSFSHCFME